MPRGCLHSNHPTNTLPHLPLKPESFKARCQSELSARPVVITRTGHYHVESLRHIENLLTLKDEPPDKKRFVDIKDKNIKRVLQDMHTLAIKWLHQILSISRIKLRPKTHPHRRKRIKTNHPDSTAEHRTNPLPARQRPHSKRGRDQ